MLQIIVQIPLFVWFILALFIIGGVRALKTRAMPLALILAIPPAFFMWSVFSFFKKYGLDLLPAFLWPLCLVAGFAVGFFHMQKLDLRFNKLKKSVEIPGSWLQLILSLSILMAKVFIGMTESLSPHLSKSPLIFSLELFGAFILGIFSGRSINCFIRYVRCIPEQLQKSSE